MKKDTQILVVLGIVTLGIYFLVRRGNSSTSNFSNFINQQGSSQVLAQIPSGYTNYISQYASPTTDKYGKRWYLYVFSNAQQQFIGNYPTSTSALGTTSTSFTKVPSCEQFVNLANQIGLQYPNYSQFSRYLQALIQAPSNPCAREWWFKNMFGVEFIAPKVSLDYANEQAIGTTISQLKTYVANTYPKYRIAIVRQ